MQSLPEDARKELSSDSNAEAQINSFSQELAHPWFTLGQLLDQGLLQTENGSDGTTLNPFYWNLNRFPHDQVHKPFFNAHHVVQQVHYLVELRAATDFPRSLSDRQVPPNVHPLLSGHWLRVEGIVDPSREFGARTATSVRLRVNLLRMFLLLQHDLLTNGGVVAEEQSLLDRLREWQTLPRALDSAIAQHPELAADRQLLTTDTLGLIEEVAELIASAIKE